MSRRRIRVLHMIQNLNYGGMERVLADIIRHTDTTTFESQVLVLSYLGRFADGLEAHATLHVADPLPRWSMLWPGPLVRQIRRIAPDVVHTHSGIWYKASLAARAARVSRLVHTDHGRPSPDSWTNRTLERLAAGRTDVVVAVSEPLSRYLVRHVQVDPAKIRVVINGVDTDLHRPRADSGSIRRELGLAPEVPILGSVGRLQWIKGYDVMVLAFGRLLATWAGPGPPPALVIGGEGAERGHVSNLTARLGLTDRVHLLGWRDDIHDLHAAFTLFTMSSRSEGTSVSLLESMSAGLCPVVTRVGGNADVLGPELSHRLVAPGDPAAIAEAWRSALEDPAGRIGDGAQARRRVTQSFGLRSMVDAYQRLYTQTSGT